jgi:DNA-binding transcriptional MerR regulator
VENDEGREYTISELAEQAGVSTRTIRYYVSEGLLPPPVGSGPTSRYTSAHRDQLAIIDRLKAQYLPLKEIRRRLIGHGHGLGSMGSSAASGPAPASRALGDAAKGPSATAEQAYPAQSRRMREISDEEQGSAFAEHRLAAAPGAYEAAAADYSMPPPAPLRHGDHSWRRVEISEEAELLITEAQYRRHQDKIDWLVQWAKRVLEP